MKKTFGTDRIRHMVIDGTDYFDAEDLLRKAKIRLRAADIKFAYSAYLTREGLTWEEVGELDKKNTIAYPEDQLTNVMLITPLAFRQALQLIQHVGFDKFKNCADELYEELVQEYRNKHSNPSVRAEPAPEEQKPTPNIGFVYIITFANNPGFYKIGKTRNLKQRVNSFQTGSPHKVVLVHSVECTNYSYLEGVLHGRYAAKRTQGEWFQLTDDEVDELKSLTVQYGRVTIKKQHKRIKATN